jgi:hypothetical protein
VLNEFVGYADFGPGREEPVPQTVVVVTFALAGVRELRLDRDRSVRSAVWRRIAVARWPSSA